MEPKCPLCKQVVSEELYEEITGIWKELREAEKRFKQQEKGLLKQKKDLQKQYEVERKKLKAEQKIVVEQKIAEKIKKYDSKLQKLQFEKSKIAERAEKRVASAVRAAEAKAKRVLGAELKQKMHESIQKQIEKATLKTHKSLQRATHTIDATKKQMATLQERSQKQQEQIKNLQTQLKNQTTPQLEGLLYEDKLMEALQKEFPKDKFTHTGKGGDILHEIVHEDKSVGSIIYECKRVGHWQTAHAEQAFNARLQRKTDFAILVTNATKKGAGGFFIEKSVIVVSPGGVIAIASILRDQIIRIAQLKLSHAQKDEAIEKTLQYLQGAEFKNALEVVIRKTIEMHDDLIREYQDHVKTWIKRNDSLKSVYIHAARVQIKTSALVMGKFELLEDEKLIKPFPGLPNLIEN